MHASLKSKTKLLLAALALVGFVSNVQAAPALADLPPAELQMECRKADPAFCRGYIQAIAEGVFTRGVTICIDTEDTSRDDMMNTVVPWIANYAGDMSDLGVYQALETLYPCEEESSD